jgi:broad specificity phosphatase PhoE
VSHDEYGTCGSTDVLSANGNRQARRLQDGLVAAC